MSNIVRIQIQSRQMQTLMFKFTSTQNCKINERNQLIHAPWNKERFDLETEINSAWRIYNHPKGEKGTERVVGDNFRPDFASSV